MDMFHISLKKTLAYFDLFGCPVTKEELYTYLFSPQEEISFDTFMRRLDTFEASKEKCFETSCGYYFLPGKQETVAMRERRVWYIEKKLKIAKRAAWLLRCIPFVKAFFVCNQIQIGVTQKSDIDVLIVVKQGRMFFTRLCITFLLGLFRLRRGKKKVTDRICLSFYVTDNASDFSSLQMGEPDIYFTYWISTLIPVYDPEDYLQKIFSNNSWATKNLPHAFESMPLGADWKVSNNTFSLFIKQGLEKMLQGKWGDKLEAATKKFQLKHMQGNKSSVQNQDSRVVISDTLLKFHENDRRDLFRQEWEKRWKI